MGGFLLEEQYHIPRVCKKCGGVMIFKGVGEYHCEDCGAVDYDDYGKVRMYIEEHHGATAAQIEDAVGVSQRAIRQMLKDCWRWRPIQGHFFIVSCAARQSGMDSIVRNARRQYTGIWSRNSVNRSRRIYR